LKNLQRGLLRYARWISSSSEDFIFLVNSDAESSLDESGYIEEFKLIPVSYDSNPMY